jgi:hypothetical protein
MARRAAQLLAPSFVAQFFISRIPLQFNNLHDCCGSMTGLSAVSANNGGPVDVRSRMGRGFANG